MQVSYDSYVLNVADDSTLNEDVLERERSPDIKLSVDSSCQLAIGDFHTISNRKLIEISLSSIVQSTAHI